MSSFLGAAVSRAPKLLGLAAPNATGLGISFGAESTIKLEGGAAIEELAQPRQGPGGSELEDKRTATSETFRLSGGALETRIYESPIHYRDDGGGWKSISADLREVSGSVLTNGANAFDTDLPSRTGTGPVRLSVDEEWIAYEVLGPSTESAEAEADMASYEASDTEVTFELSSFANGIKGGLAQTATQGGDNA